MFERTLPIFFFFLASSRLEPNAFLRAWASFGRRCLARNHLFSIYTIGTSILHILYFRLVRHRVEFCSIVQFLILIVYYFLSFETFATWQLDSLLIIGRRKSPCPKSRESRYTASSSSASIIHTLYTWIPLYFLDRICEIISYIFRICRLYLVLRIAISGTLLYILGHGARTICAVCSNCRKKQPVSFYPRLGRWVTKKKKKWKKKSNSVTPFTVFVRS